MNFLRIVEFSTSQSFTLITPAKFSGKAIQSLPRIPSKPNTLHFRMVIISSFVFNLQ
jgi:hypothetical protein